VRAHGWSEKRCVLEGASSLSREAPRLCRGGSSSLTFTAVVRPKNLAIVSRHTRELKCHDGRLQESKPHHEGVHVQCPVVPKNKTDAVSEGEGHDHVPSVLQAALSGPNSKAPGSAGGYLLRETFVRAWQAAVLFLSGRVGDAP
jgi:hypothetical protein